MISSLVKALGLFGTLGIVAPLPVADSTELPREFCATTLAITEAPLPNENGPARRTLAGIVHAVFVLIVALFTPSQLFYSYDHELSVC